MEELNARLGLGLRQAEVITGFSRAQKWPVELWRNVGGEADETSKELMMLEHRSFFEREPMSQIPGAPLST